MKKNRLLTSIIVLLPVLNIYSSPISGVGVGDIAIACCVPYLAYIFIKNKVVLNKCCYALFLFYLYCILTTFINVGINGYDLKDAATRLLVLSFYVVTILLITSTCSFNIEEGFKLYSIMAVVIALIVLAQTIAFKFFNKNLYFLIPGLSYNQSSLATYDLYVAQYDAMYLYSFRPTAIFLEPSHIALYLLLPLYYLLNRQIISHKQWVIIVIISIGVVLSSSGTGYLVLLIAWGLFIIKVLINNKNAGTSLTIIGLTIVAIIVISATPYFETILFRLRDFGSGSESSINVRLLKGFSLFGRLPIMQQLFGMGCGTYNSFVQLLHKAGETIESYEYMSSISYILCSTGIFGAILYAKFCANVIKYKTYLQSGGLLLLLLGMYFTGSILFSCYDFIYYILLLTPLMIDRNHACLKANIWLNN